MLIKHRTTLDFYHEGVRLLNEFFLVLGLSEAVIKVITLSYIFYLELLECTWQIKKPGEKLSGKDG